MIVGEALKRWREIRGLSQLDPDDKSGVGYASIARIETGRQDPTMAMLTRLAKALRIDVLDFFTRVRPKQSGPHGSGHGGSGGRRTHAGDRESRDSEAEADHAPACQGPWDFRAGRRVVDFLVLHRRPPAPAVHRPARARREGAWGAAEGSGEGATPGTPLLSRRGAGTTAALATKVRPVQ